MPELITLTQQELTNLLAAIQPNQLDPTEYAMRRAMEAAKARAITTGTSPTPDSIRKIFEWTENSALHGP